MSPALQHNRDTQKDSLMSMELGLWLGLGFCTSLVKFLLMSGIT